MSPSNSNIAKVLGMYFVVSFVILASNLFLSPNVYDVNLVAGTLSLVFLVPLYLWYRKHRQHTVLLHQVNKRDKRTMVFWVVALFVLAMAVRIPSVLIFGMAYEKTPLIFLVILTIVLIEGKDLSIFGFKTEKLMRGILLGLIYYFLLEFIAEFGMVVLVYAITREVLVTGFDPVPFVLTMPFMMLAVGISEEGLFRGYIQTHVAQFYSRWKTILLQAVLFGLWHFVWYIAPLNLFDMFFHITEAFVVGLLLGYFYSICQNLTPLILVHGLSDCFPRSLIQSTTAWASLQNLSATTQILTYVIPYVIAIVALFILTKPLITTVLGTSQRAHI